MPDNDTAQASVTEDHISYAEIKKVREKMDLIDKGQSEIMELLRKDAPLVSSASDVSPIDRAQRESDRGSLMRTTQTSVRYGRGQEHLQAVLAAVTANRQDVQDAIDYAILDFITTIEDLKKWASKVGRKNRAEMTMKIIQWILIALALTVVGFELVQPQDLTIIQNALATPRNQFIFIGLIVLGASVYLTSFFWSRRSRRSTVVA